MCFRCNQRAAEIVAASVAAKDGDFSKIVPAIAFNVRTLAEDVATLGASALASARQRLGSRR